MPRIKKTTTLKLRKAALVKAGYSNYEQEPVYYWSEPEGR
jgi:hypothetical protein